ncbi:TFIIB-type zinc finger domain-containing protein [Fluviibacterium sp. DFM31]|uniref:TFIIB-type zinc finger domain-containing protein n=1 Tax=Meridianimarinicoccus marinus TaxID=3231483 RepID=A0ABV3L4W8_9RHOB
MTVETHSFPCAQCGADLRFDPASGKLVCDHCGYEDEARDLSTGPWGGSAIRELDFAAALKEQLPLAEMEETRTASCSSCGAEVEFDGATHGKECPFCASPIVADTGTNRHIKPKALLPFLLSEPDARKAMTNWLGRLWFAPSGLQKYARHGRKMDGVYIPYWTFDARTASDYRGERGTVYYTSRTVTRNGQRQTERVARIRWRRASGRVARMFDDVLVLAARSLPKTFTDALPPWDLSQLVPYNPEYLAGMRAEAYTVELDEGFHEARAHMDRVIERDVRFDIGGDRQRVHNIQTRVSDVTFKHVLLPIWVAAYKYQGRSYRFVINGQTGRVQGERPYSKGKIALAVIAALVLAAGAAFLFAAQNGGGGY